MQQLHMQLMHTSHTTLLAPCAAATCQYALKTLVAMHGSNVPALSAETGRQSPCTAMYVCTGSTTQIEGLIPVHSFIVVTKMVLQASMYKQQTKKVSDAGRSKMSSDEEYL